MIEEAHPAEQHTGRAQPGPVGNTPARARQPAGSWLYSIDPGYDPDGTVPPHAVIGAWPVGPDGEPGEFVTNPGYRPSQLSLLFTDQAGSGPAGDGGPAGEAGLPTDPVDAAMRRAATGQGTEAAVLDALAGTTVYLPTNAAGELTAYEDEDGPYVTVLTDPRQAPPAAPRLLPVESAELLGLLPDETALWINPESEVSMGVSSAQLRAALATRAAPAGRAAAAAERDPRPDAPSTGLPGLPGIPRKGRVSGGG
ncbi:SseB family protein [Streptomyces polygonati]|uniref:SseB family protein n=1 Tax=Streptomyces polygonati TaxID=1617087 RepID=A0ABV8HI31_9ACTN